MIMTEPEGRPEERLYDNGSVRAFLDTEAGEAYIEVRDGAAGWAVRSAVEWISNYGLYPLDLSGVTREEVGTADEPATRHYCAPLSFGSVG